MTRLLTITALLATATYIAGAAVIVWLGTEEEPRAPWRETR